MTNVIALIVVNMQVGAFESNLMPPIAESNNLLLQVSKLITKARNMSVPIFFIQQNGAVNHPLEQGKAGWCFHPKVAPLKDDIVIQKCTADSFYNTTLWADLKLRQINKLVIAGLQTEYCIDITCRRAFSLGYKVTLAKDAHGTWDTDNFSAKQIIEHYNNLLKNWFVELKEVSEIEFSNL